LDELAERVSAVLQGEHLGDVASVAAALAAHAIGRFYSTKLERLDALERVVFPAMRQRVEAFDDVCNTYAAATTTLQ
jgi:hypothetical protein